MEGVRVYHCGTRRNAEGDFETNGGRVLALVAQAATREAARDKVYAEAAKVRLPRQPAPHRYRHPALFT